MSLKERTINVDIMTKEYTKLKYKQGDSNQILKFKFYKNGSELDLTGYIAGIFYEKPNNEVLEKTGTISTNTVTTTITSGVLNTAGVVKTEIFLTKNDEVSISFTILIEVETSIDKNTAVQEKEEWDVIRDLLNSSNNVSMIDDSSTATNKTWSSSKIDSQIKDLANVGKPTDEQVANVINQAIADGTLSVNSIVFKDITTNEIFEVGGSTGGSGGSTGGSGGSTGGSGGSTGSEKLNLSITDGLTHLYDFQTLTSNSTVSEDLVGTNNITYNSEFATDGGILSKGKHLNCGNLLNNEFTAFLTMKIDSNYNSNVSTYTFYCGDRTICTSSNKINTSHTAWENRQLHEGVLYTLGIKWDDTTKTMYSYINGELILASTNASFNSNDRSVYISFDTNSNTGKNYNLAIYNKQLSDEDIKTISSELYNRVSSDKTNTGLSIMDNLQVFYDMINIGESATYIESKVGDHRLNIANGYTFNNGLIINNSGSYLSEADKAPHDNQFTYFLKLIIPSTSTKGNKLIESQKAVLSGSKTSLSLTVANVSTTPISPELDVSNVVAISVDNINKQAKLYYKGVLKQTITFTDDCLAMKGDYYMLENDMVHQYLVLYDRILTDEEVATITSELEAI